MALRSTAWLLATVAALIFSTATPAGQHAFQGLEWGATEQQIADRFAGLPKAAECSDTQRAASERSGLACDSPVIAPYVVAGIPFRLVFTLTRDERLLDGVTLSYEGDGPDASELRWSQRHQTLRNALIDRYGPAEKQNADTEGATLRAFASWREAGTVIELQSSYVRAGGGPGANAGRERYVVAYRARHRGDAGKL